MEDIEDIIDDNLDNFVIELSKYDIGNKKEYDKILIKLRKYIK